MCRCVTVRFCRRPRDVSTVSVCIVLEHGLDNLCETVSKLIQDHVLSLGGALGLLVTLFSLGQQTAAHTLHYSRGYH